MNQPSQPPNRKSEPSEIDGYALLDFGNGRKLEQFGELVLDRPSPAADGKRKGQPRLWKTADVILDEKGRVASATARSQPFLDGSPDWLVRWRSITLQLKMTPFGHVGVFPEQSTNWKLLFENCSKFVSPTGAAPRALNLFAYTGGSTMAMATGGAEVVHIDASEPAVTWARRNCESSGLSALAIRWIQEDARKFVAREAKRGNKYDIIVLDPPSFGHSPKGKRWDINEHLPALLDDAAQILESGQCEIVLSGHSSIPSATDIAGMLRGAVLSAGRQLTQPSPSVERLALETESGRKLDAGYTVYATVKPL